MIGFIRAHLSAPERLAGSLWGAIIVLSVTGSVGALSDFSPLQILAAGTGTAFAWAFVEATMNAYRDVLESRMEGTGVTRRGIQRRAWAAGAIQFVAAVPILLPLALVPWPDVALRASNAMAVVVLAALGWASGRLARGRAWAWSLAFVVAGSAIVAAIVALEE